MYAPAGLQRPADCWGLVGIRCHTPKSLRDYVERATLHLREYPADVLSDDAEADQLDPTEEGFGPYEKNLYELPEEELARIRSFPESLGEALDALETDREYLTRDGVFPDYLLDEWIATKRKDIEDMRVVPHPWEVARYYDI